MAHATPLAIHTVADLLRQNPFTVDSSHYLSDYTFMQSSFLLKPVPVHWWIGLLIQYTATYFPDLDWQIVDNHTTGQVVRVLSDCFITQRDIPGLKQHSDLFSCPYTELLLFAVHLATELRLPVPQHLHAMPHRVCTARFNPALLMLAASPSLVR